MSHNASGEGVLRLPSEPLSVATARAFVGDQLARAGRDEWTDTATLVVSELVTNAVLHAHTSVELTVRVLADHARIEVRDFSPSLPLAHPYRDDASTGRGLDLVAALSSAHGVEHLGDAGKIVWCCVAGTVPEQELSADALLDAWSDPADDVPANSQVAPDAVTVTLCGLSPALWLAAHEHHDAIMRELALVRAVSTEPVSSPTIDLHAADEARFLINAAIVTELSHARKLSAVPLQQHDPGGLPPVPPVVDVQLCVGHQEAEAFARLQDALDEGERMAAAGRFLVRPGLPEIIAVRDWACEQVIAQVAGTPPTPWIGAHDARFESGLAGPSADEWDVEWIRSATSGVIAVDDANRIVAVSPPLGEVLGWQPDALVGRRVVAIIPTRFREAHVAGFSRHLSTGVARALDVDLRLPVLRADGGEVECHLFISADMTASGRRVYVARISPVSSPSG
jgi:PAS domain S-box-containing protein